MKKLNVIVTGASGMVGEGVMRICLNHPQVESVLVVGRRPCGTTHPKLKEIVHNDFYNLAPIADQLKNYDACYFCLGVSSVGKTEEEYKRITYDLTMRFAQTVLNPNMTFCYISGMGTDSTEQGKLMWARVKGKTENDLIKMPFKAAFAFRPGFIEPIEGMKHTLSPYKYLKFFFPVFKRLFSKSYVTLENVGRAMINVTLNGYDKKVLDCVEITKSGSAT